MEEGPAAPSGALEAAGVDEVEDVVVLASSGVVAVAGGSFCESEDSWPESCNRGAALAPRGPSAADPDGKGAADVAAPLGLGEEGEAATRTSCRSPGAPPPPAVWGVRPGVAMVLVLRQELLQHQPRRPR
jgi:hypothetical protein